MLKTINKSRQGFTLVEIMIVVAIIALLAAIAVPNFLRARKRSQATHIINDLRMLDAAIDQYAADTGKVAGFAPAFADLQNYLKTDTTLYATGQDIFGDSYGPFAVDSVPQVPTSAFNTLSDVADASFWGQYYSADSGSGGGSQAPSAGPYAQYNSGNQMDFETMYNAIWGGAMGQLNNIVSNGGTPTSAQIAAAQTQNQQLNVVASGGGLQNSGYYNSILGGYPAFSQYLSAPSQSAPPTN